MSQDPAPYRVLRPGGHVRRERDRPLLAGFPTAVDGRADGVLVSRTVKDLVAGSGTTLEKAGIHTLKSVPEQWELYRATA